MFILSFERAETEKKVWFVYNSLLEYGFHRLVTKNQEVVKSKGNTPVRRNINAEIQQNPPAKKEIADYNEWAKYVRSKFTKLSGDAIWIPPIEEEDLVKNLRIYQRMTNQQKEKAVEVPCPDLNVNTIEKSSDYDSAKAGILKVMRAQEMARNNGDLEGFMQGYWKSDSLKFYGRNGLTKGWQNTLDNYKRGYHSKAETGTLNFVINDVS